MWGRSVFDNIRKFLQFQLTVNVVALVTTFISAMGGGSPPINAVMMLWINLIMDTMGALALGTESPTMELLNRKPYKRDAPLINVVMWRNILVQSFFQIALLVYLLSEQGASDMGVTFKGEDLQHQTLVFNVFVLCQLFNEFNARSIGDDFDIFKGIFGNPIFVGIVIITIGVQLSICEYGGSFFKTSHLDQELWKKSALLASLTFPVGALMRLIPVKESQNSFASTSWVPADVNASTNASTTSGFSFSMLVWLMVVAAAPAMVWQEFGASWAQSLSILRHE
jgi:P-type Ca2+ transporter type 2C